MAKRRNRRRTPSYLKNRSKRRRSGKDRLKRLFSLLLALLLAVGGYQYYLTGDIAQTAAYFAEIPEKITELPELMAELPEMAAKLPETISALPDAAASLPVIISSLPEQADHLPELVENVGNQAARMFHMGKTSDSVSADDIPEYQGEDYVVLDQNTPHFDREKKEGPAYEFYSELDWLGRCGYTEAKITRGMMPTEKRGPIGMVKPTGWHTVKYQGIDGNYLYNRCHLIGYQLTGENANTRNLITGTRYFNTVGMLPWENQVAEYVRETGDAVMYRVTPVYEGDDLVARGVEMEGESVGSDEICFHVFVYNIQPGIGIDYATGDSWKE